MINFIKKLFSKKESPYIFGKEAIQKHGIKYEELVVTAFNPRYIVINLWWGKTDVDELFQDGKRPSVADYEISDDHLKAIYPAYFHLVSTLRLAGHIRKSSDIVQIQRLHNIKYK